MSYINLSGALDIPSTMGTKAPPITEPKGAATSGTDWMGTVTGALSTYAGYKTAQQVTQQEAYKAQQAMYAASAPASTPKWVMPVAIGGIALLAAYVIMRK